MSRTEPYEDWHIALEQYVKSYYYKDREAQLLKGRLEGERESTVKIIRGMSENNIPFETALECAGIDKQTYEQYVSETQQ